MDLRGAITGWLLVGYGFEANATQTQESLKGNRMLISIYPAVGALLSAAVLLIYKLSDSFMEKITEELASKRD